ncbi:MAG: peptidase [Planctomycetes bacterium]|nr:peptidase [Planctomycetota bacterium]MBL7038518.1 peptidase [Pirellulaceae bacterium]
MSSLRWNVVLWLFAFSAAAPNAWAQRAPLGPRDPHIGYVYPAGGQQGTTLEITVGGQFLDGAGDVLVSGKGVEATVTKHTKPLTQKQINDLRQKVQEARKRAQANRSKPFGQRGDFKSFAKIAEELGVSAEELKTLAELRKQFNDPKRQINPQIAETATLRVTFAPDAEPGEREIRLVTASGLSNPLYFHVGQLPEYQESEPNDKTADTGIDGPLPAIVNGQILPGDVDRFRFQARKGERLVVAASARKLIPYLADAVPGWFQATLGLYDASGKEVAYDDDFRFHPDPVLYYEIPEEGEYVLEIKDAIYRGREDFVYRITLGELPFVANVFPLGGRNGDSTNVELTGWNLPVDKLALDAKDKGPGVHPVSILQNERVVNRVPFAVDDLSECLEQEPNNDAANAQRVKPPLIVNGRIDKPGDWDVFCFECRAGGQIFAEVRARRLNSPLDSVLKLTDASGRQLAVNDDHEDKGAGLTTHHADSRLSVTIPENGLYYLHLGDTQHKGGAAYAYRLHINAQRPDFELRVVPASINAQAGTTVPITVYALRRDGFSDDIELELKDAPPGFTLSGAWVPANQDKVRLTLTVPSTAPDDPISVHLEGRAKIGGREVRRQAVPAEDMMQAFIYRHLVPADDWMVAVTEGRRFRSPLKLLDRDPVKLPAGGTARVRISAPRAPFLDQIQLALSDPPEGIEIKGVTRVAGGVAIDLKADAEKIQPGLKGNLLVNAFIERTFGRAGGTQPGNKRRIPVGTLPAIPFEIVEP